MASKTNMTPDGRHVQLGETDTVTMPPGFTAPDDGAFCPQYFGREMEGGDAGFGSAYIEQEGYGPEEAD